jgi:hypothetical protein
MQQCSFSAEPNVPPVERAVVAIAAHFRALVAQDFLNFRS